MNFNDLMKKMHSDLNGLQVKLSDKGFKANKIEFDKITKEISNIEKFDKVLKSFPEMFIKLGYQHILEVFLREKKIVPILKSFAKPTGNARFIPTELFHYTKTLLPDYKTSHGIMLTPFENIPTITCSECGNKGAYVIRNDSLCPPVGRMPKPSGTIGLSREDIAQDNEGYSLYRYFQTLCFNCYTCESTRQQAISSFELHKKGDSIFIGHPTNWQQEGFFINFEKF